MSFDDLKNNQELFLKRLFDFLDIEAVTINDKQKKNAASIQKYSFLNTIIKCLKLNVIISTIIPKSLIQSTKSVLTNTEPIPKMSSADKEILLPYFKSDLEKLQVLIDADISSWYK
ncbi:hypothetical protein [Methyloprofundus sedimenti]|nr:hypothetical protein [Methyloprofundus sedimenti]